MEFESTTRYDLIQYAMNNIHLKVDFKGGDTFDEIIAKNIIMQAHYSLCRQFDSHNKLYNNSFNSIVYHCLINTIIKDDYYISIRDRWIEVMHSYNIDDLVDLDAIICDTNKDIELFNFCKLFIDMKKSHQNKKATLEDNEVASDSFLFETVIKQAAINLFGKESVSRKLSNTSGIGQSLIADTVIKHADMCVILDAKFYNSKPLSTENNRTVYKFQSNRYQMCSYIDQLRSNTLEDLEIKDIVGVIIHAIDSDEYTLDNNHMDIGDNSITLEFVDIRQSAENIINQIKSIITKYFI